MLRRNLERGRAEAKAKAVLMQEFGRTNARALSLPGQPDGETQMVVSFGPAIAQVFGQHARQIARERAKAGTTKAEMATVGIPLEDEQGEEVEDFGGFERVRIG